MSMVKLEASSPALGKWTTRGIHRSDVTDAWQAALADNYGPWQVHQAVSPYFAASVKNRDFGGVRVVECVCDPCAGRRLPQLIAKDDQAYIGVQITKAGSETFRFGGDAVNVGPGDLLIWTSNQPTEFTVIEKLHKVSIILPWTDVQQRLPRGARFNGTMMDSRSGIGAVLFGHVESLAAQMEILGEADQAAVRRATLELLTAAMNHRVDAPPRGLATRYLKQLQDYVLSNLQDENMTPGSIAAANHMSPRYVHMLFAQTGISVSSWIKEQRLARCGEDLRSWTYRDASVAEIAYAWGFSDPTHFSRAFKQQFGLNPRAYREQARSNSSK
jgi:AraC-like DNA-binding protein